MVLLDNEDYMLFYGVSSLGWDAENDTHINPYALIKLTII